MPQFSPGASLDPLQGSQSCAAGAVVESMLDAWRRGDLDEILQYFSEDAVCHPMPMAPLVGRDAIRAGLGQVLTQSTVVRFETLRQLERDDLVMNERLDRFIIAGKPVDLPVMGVFELTGGKIRAWRDYFDAAILAPRD